MPQSNRQTQAIEHMEEIIISATVENQMSPMRICWNTGEEKNCSACYLSKGCKAKI
jgi:hypothetical protein